MELTFAPRGIIQLDDVRIIYRNFTGRKTKYNKEGDKNFSIRIDDTTVADALVDAGWNVRIKPPREEGEPPFMHLPVKVKFNDRGPNVYLRSGNHTVRLNEESICCLDNMDIRSVNLDVRPFNWTIQGDSGRTGYLYSMEVIQEIDRFTAQYAEEECPEEVF